MIDKIFTSPWWGQMLVGLIPIVIGLLENLILSRRKTMPVVVLDQLLFSVPAIVLFIFKKSVGTWISFIFAFVFIILLLVKKYYDKWYSDLAYMDFNESVYSVSRLINSLSLRSTKKKDIVVGQIMPVNYLDLKNNRKPVPISEQVLSGSVLITGSTGSGKTTTMKSIMIQAAMRKKSVVFFDFKGETDILDDLQKLADSLGIPFYEFSARRCTFSYDPLINLNETGRVEALLNTRRWSADGSDEHYKTSTQLLIQNLVRAYDEYRKQSTVEQGKNYLKGLYEFTPRYKPTVNERDGLNTLVKQLEIILTSRAKDLFTSDKEKFSFERDDQYIIAFSFISANKSLANSLSSFIFQDLMDRGTGRAYNPKLLLTVDEFGTLENSAIIKDILEKGRSGGIQTVFSVLDINQIAMTTGDHFVQAILGTINTLILHAGATTKTAELMGGVSKYDIENDIMSLEKPQNGKPPTALFVSKFKILNKRGSQEIHRIIPFIDEPTTKKSKKTYIPEKIRPVPDIMIEEPTSPYEEEPQYYDYTNTEEEVDYKHIKPSDVDKFF